MRSNPARTQQRIAELEKYMSANVTGADGFCCKRESACKASALVNRRTGERKPNVSF